MCKLKSYCPQPKDKTKIKKAVWKKGEDGTQYKWNKVGEIKDYYFNCEECGNEQHFLPM